MPAVIRKHADEAEEPPLRRLGPVGPFPDAPLRRVRERRWLHYAFLSGDARALGLVANVALLGPSPEDPQGNARCTSILLLHDAEGGWHASQFNAETRSPFWSAFRLPHPHGRAGPLEIRSTAGRVAVALDLTRTSRPCTAQTAPFSAGHFLRWQSETGVVARGPWRIEGRLHEDVLALGYHERVRGYWGWPELGSWVFGFANDPARAPDGAPLSAAVFTLIQPPDPEGAATGSVMLWRRGRLVRHFPRRRISVAVSGRMPRDRVLKVPALAGILGVAPAPPIPARLVIHGRQGGDEVLLDFEGGSAARVVIPNETGIDPFSVHEVIGACRVDATIGGAHIEYCTAGIVEFAGGAGGE